MKEFYANADLIVLRMQCVDNSAPRLLLRLHVGVVFSPLPNAVVAATLAAYARRQLGAP